MPLKKNLFIQAFAFVLHYAEHKNVKVFDKIINKFETHYIGKQKLHFCLGDMGAKKAFCSYFPLGVLFSYDVNLPGSSRRQGLFTRASEAGQRVSCAHC
jgi:hypothetical protein